MSQRGSYEPVATNEESPISQPETPANVETAAGQTLDEITTQSSTPTDDRVTTPPPPYSAVYVALPVVDTDESADLPPAYTEATVKLPTYDEAAGGRCSTNARLTLDTETEMELGSDCTFATCFFLAFIFNWIGFLAGYCMTSTIAGRYGAIAGFGVSVVKWSWIMKNASHKDFFGAPWVWWMFVATGWLVFMRGFLVYLHVRLIARKGSTFLTRPLDTAATDSSHLN